MIYADKATESALDNSQQMEGHPKKGTAARDSGDYLLHATAGNLPLAQKIKADGGKTPWHARGFSSLVASMKNIQKNLIRSILVGLFIAVSAGRTLAYDHDDTGWFDEHHQHHAFIQHNGHNGYWDHDKSGAVIFISI